MKFFKAIDEHKNPMKSFAALSAFLLANMWFVGGAFAQQAAETSVAGNESTIPGGTLAVIAYIVLWVLIFGFVFATMRRQQKIDRELDELERRMDEVFEDLDKA